MSALATPVVVAAIVANAGIAVADVVHAPFVLANAAEVHVAKRWVRPLATHKLAGAIGLALGLAGVDALGLAAAIGLTAFFVGAVAFHLRHHVLHNIAFPLTYLALAVAALVVFGSRG